MFDPVRHAFGDSVDFNKHVASLGSVLDLIRSPHAVFLEISNIIVDSVNRSSIWTWTHIGKKVNKAFLPLFAHGNSSCSVVGIIFIGWIVASIDHATPSSVPLERLSRESEFGFSGRINAATRGSFPTSGRGSSGYSFLPAVTQEPPVSFFLDGVAVVERHQFSKPLASDVLETNSTF